MNRIKLVILDLVMTRMNGKETFIELKKINPEVKVIYTSGFSSEDSIDELLNMGAGGFIQKPYRMSDLCSIVDRLKKS